MISKNDLRKSSSLLEGKRFDKNKVRSLRELVYCWHSQLLRTDPFRTDSQVAKLVAPTIRKLQLVTYKTCQNFEGRNRTNQKRAGQIESTPLSRTQAVCGCSNSKTLEFKGSSLNALFGLQRLRSPNFDQSLAWRHWIPVTGMLGMPHRIARRASHCSEPISLVIEMISSTWVVL